MTTPEDLLDQAQADLEAVAYDDEGSLLVAIQRFLQHGSLYDHTHGAVLAIMTGMLVLFMVNVPLLMAFTVARFQAPDRPQ